MGSPVLHLVSDTRRRGAQVFASQLVVELLRTEPGGHRLVALRRSDPAESLAIEVVDHRAAVKRLLADHDRVVAHGSITLDACARFAPGRFVYRSIGDPAFWGRRPDRRVKTGLLLHRARAVVALWPGAAGALAERYRLPAERIHVIPNGIPTPSRRAGAAAVRSALGVAPHQPLVAHLGALSPEKRVDRAIEAVAGLAGAQLVCVGEGPLREQLAAQAGALAPGRVQFLGSVADPAPIVSAADALVVLSTTEGMPASVLEAAAVGTPVVAHPVGALADLATHLPGLHLVAGEQPAAVAEALRAAMATPCPPALPERYTLASVAREWAELLAGPEVAVA